MFKLWIYQVSFLLNEVVISSSRFTHSFMLKDLDNLTFPDSYKIRDVIGIKSIRFCSAICHDEPQCMTFAYNSIFQACKLMNIGFVYASDGLYELDRKTFVLGDAGCPLQKGFLPYRQCNLCLHASNTSMNRQLAEEYCSNLTSRLVILDSVQKVTGFGLMMKQQKTKPDYHIGLKKIAGVWQWENGRVLATEKNWQYGQPYCGDTSGCLCTFSIGTKDYHWFDEVCNGQARAVCEPL